MLSISSTGKCHQDGSGSRSIPWWGTGLLAVGLVVLPLATPVCLAQHLKPNPVEERSEGVGDVPPTPVRHHALYLEVGGIALVQLNISYEYMFEGLSLGAGFGGLDLGDWSWTSIMLRSSYLVFEAGLHRLIWVLGGGAAFNRCHVSSRCDDEVDIYAATGPAYEYRGGFLFRVESVVLWTPKRGGIFYELPGVPGTSILPGIVLGTSW